MLPNHSTLQTVKDILPLAYITDNNDRNILADMELPTSNSLSVISFVVAEA